MREIKRFTALLKPLMKQDFDGSTLFVLMLCFRSPQIVPVFVVKTCTYPLTPSALIRSHPMCCIYFHAEMIHHEAND